MSVSSEETHDDSAQVFSLIAPPSPEVKCSHCKHLAWVTYAEDILQVHSSDNKGCNNLEVRGESPTGSQDSKVTGCQQSFGRLRSVVIWLAVA